MTTQNSQQTSTRLKLLLTQVRTFLTDLFQGLYLVVYLGIRLLPLLGSLALEKLFSVSQWLKISLTLILMGIAYTLTLRLLSINHS